MLNLYYVLLFDLIIINFVPELEFQSYIERFYAGKWHWINTNLVYKASLHYSVQSTLLP